MTYIAVFVFVSVLLLPIVATTISGIYIDISHSVTDTVWENYAFK